MIKRNLQATSALLDYLFVEPCRICRQLIVNESSPARTLCRYCWEPLQAQDAQIDSCTVSGMAPLNVAHAVAYDETMKTLIYRLKYDHDRLVACDLSLLLFKAYVAIKSTLLDADNAILVPVPLSHWRMIQRGFNQSELLAKHIRQKASVQVSAKLLSRSKHTRPQHKLNRQERAGNLSGAFKCARLDALQDKTTIILVDDIHTSGATLAEAARTLRAGGACHVAGITVARALLS
jgi:ComF family protein